MLVGGSGNWTRDEGLVQNGLKTPPLGFLGSGIIKSLTQACQTPNRVFEFPSPQGKTVFTNNGSF
jgi:hypothetical protein